MIFGINQSISQSGAMLSDVDDHDFPLISISYHFQCTCDLSNSLPNTLLVLPTSFLAVFQLLHIFLHSFLVSQFVPVSVCSPHSRKRLPGVYVFSFQVPGNRIVFATREIFILILCQSRDSYHPP